MCEVRNEYKNLVGKSGRKTHSEGSGEYKKVNIEINLEHEEWETGNCFAWLRIATSSELL